jgi:hypothetical protein
VVVVKRINKLNRPRSQKNKVLLANFRVFFFLLDSTLISRRFGWNFFCRKKLEKIPGSLPRFNRVDMSTSFGLRGTPKLDLIKKA